MIGVRRLHGPRILHVGSSLSLLQVVRSTHESAYEPVSRQVALQRWSARAPTAADGSATRGVGMNFARAVKERVGSTRKSTPVVTSTVADVAWDVHERIDYYVQFSVPSTWVLTEHVVNNHVSIQCSPPPTGSGAERPSVHGIALNCFAYHRKVTNPNCSKLLEVFLSRFNSSVSNSLEVVTRCDGSNMKSEESGTAEAKKNSGASEGASPAEGGSHSLCETIAHRLSCAVAEITFTPRPGEPLAHGLCRAFYNSNRHVHYIVVVAVPENEFSVSSDLISHAIMSVIETRVESMTRNM